MLQTGQLTSPYSLYLPIAKAYDSSDGKKWIFEAPLSEPGKDLQKERMNMTGLRKGLEVFKRLDMPVDWDHLWERTREPKWLIGKGMTLYDAPHPKTGEDVPWVRGVLFKSKEIARQAKEHYDSCQEAGSGGLGISVAGSVIERDPLDKSHIIEPMVTSIALTPVPVVDNNAGTVQFFGKALIQAEEVGLANLPAGALPIISDLYSRVLPVFQIANTDLHLTSMWKAMEATGAVPRSGPGANAMELEHLAGEKKSEDKEDDEEDDAHLQRVDLGKAFKRVHDRLLGEQLGALLTRFPGLAAH